MGMGEMRNFELSPMGSRPKKSGEEHDKTMGGVVEEVYGEVERLRESETEEALWSSVEKLRAKLERQRLEYHDIGVKIAEILVQKNLKQRFSREELANLRTRFSKIEEDLDLIKEEIKNVLEELDLEIKL